MMRCALWEEGFSSGEISPSLGSPRGTTWLQRRLDHCFVEIERHFRTRPAPVVFRAILLPTLLANPGWNLPIHLCGWNADTI
jgi:hypothetical protein